MTSNSNGRVLGWVALAVSVIALATGAFVLLAAPAGGSAYGGTSSGGPVFNAGAQFPVGLSLGTQQQNTTGATLSIPTTDNQISWLNTSSQGVYVFDLWAYQNGIASSTYKLYVGTSTTARISSDFVAPWAETVDGAQVATGTPASVVADFAANHKTSYPGTIYVAPGTYLFAQVQAAGGCNVSGKCETATSTKRGWTTISIPFYYKFK